MHTNVLDWRQHETQAGTRTNAAAGKLQLGERRQRVRRRHVQLAQQHAVPKRKPAQLEAAQLLERCQRGVRCIVRGLASGRRM